MMLTSRTEACGNRIWSSETLVQWKPSLKKVRREELSIDGAFMLHNVLSQSECDQIIRNAETIGFSTATLNLGNGKSVVRRQERSCQRLLLEVSNLNMLWKRLLPHLSRTAIGRKEYKPVGLNSRLRILKYQKGQFFRKHYDGGHQQSLMTLIIYVSEDCKGGETNFFKGSRCVESVRPQRGSALLFFHDRHPLSPLHEGSDVRKGLKYILRTDVYFEEVQ